MKKTIAVAVTGLALCLTAAGAHATVSMFEDGGGVQSWVCGSLEASYGKTVTGAGFTGWGTYKCVAKGWTFEAETPWNPSCNCDGPYWWVGLYGFLPHPSVPAWEKIG